MAFVIEGPEYQQTREKLKQDPIVIDMAGGLKDVPLSELTHDDGHVTYDFMLASNAEYTKRAGHGPNAHIGGVAEALLMLVKEARGIG